MNEQTADGQTIDKKSIPFSVIQLGIIAAVALAAIVTGAFFVSGSARRRFERSAREELSQLRQNMELRFSEGFNEQLALALQMAKSPLIVSYFENPENEPLRNNAIAEVAAYQDSFLSKLSFMINDKDLQYYANGEKLYTLDKSIPDSAWYVNIMQTNKSYEFNVDYDIGLKQTFLWLNCVVRDVRGTALGLIGTGIPLTGFVETMYSHLNEDCTMYLYNSALETCGSTDLRHLEEKTPITKLVSAFAGHEQELTGEEARFVSRGNSVYALSPLGSIGWNIILFQEYTVAAFLEGAALPFAVCLVLFVFLSGGTLAFFRIHSLHSHERTASSELMGEIQSLVIAAKENATTAQEQSAAVKEIVATMEDNTALSENIASKIQDVSSVAGKSSVDVADGVGRLEQNVAQLLEIAEANQRMIDGIKDLGEKVNNIWDIVSLINSVADQAKIIAFNAELEASSAGEAGKNFHIVATEIRRLADGIIDGTKEIKERITEIQHSSDSLILASESGTEKIHEGVESANSLSERFASIKNASELTAGSAGDITQIIQQQATASEQILITLRQIALGVEDFGSTTKSISKASEKLRRIAEGLNG